MLKQVMNNNKLTFYILFCIIYVTQCKVAYRREDGEGTNAEQGNLIPTEGTKDQQPNLVEANDAVEDQQSPKDADGIKEDQPDSIDADGAGAVEDQQSPKAPDGAGAVEDHQSPKASDGAGAVEDQQNPKAPDGAVEDQQSPKDADGIKEKSEDQPDSIELDGPKDDEPNSVEANGPKEGNHKPIEGGGAENSNGCWISFNEQSHFEKMNQLEQKYKNARDAYEKDVDTQQFNQRIVSAMAQKRGIAERALQKFHGNPNVIPAGLNLGSYCMMKMPGSMLFFYRLKLRNNTRFTVNYIHNDFKQLTLTLRLSLNDLHLVGEYERALTSKEEPSKLYYRPNKGEVEFLLRDVKYKVEGRYRLLDGRLHLEHIISEIPPMQILMRYTLDNDGKSSSLDPVSLRDYLDRMQIDLDHWLKDYFNDFLMLYGTAELKKNNEIQQYENEKTVLLNDFSDQVMDILNNRVKIKGPEFIMPDFLLTAANGMEIKLYDGVVRGLDTMYRRSVTTSKRVNEVRFIDADIGFSKLKSEYRYDIFVKTGMPPVSGVFVLNSDDVTAHMALQIVGYKPSVPDLLITYMNHGKPESLTVEGPASRIIANFKHLLEHNIISIMSSTLIHQIRSLSFLTKCDSQLPGEDDADGADYDMTTPIKPKHDDDEPTEQPANNNDDDAPPELPDNNDDDGPTEQPDNEDDGPPELPDNNDDDGSTELPNNNNEDDDTPELPDNNDEDEPTEHSDNNNDEGPAELPEYPDDDVPSEPTEDNNDYEPTATPEYTRDEPSENEHNDDVTGQPYPNDKKPEYAFDRKESIELELPSKDGSAQGQSYKIDHNETFSLTKLNNDDDRIVLSAAGDADVAAPKKESPGQIVKLMASGEDK